MNIHSVWIIWYGHFWKFIHLVVNTYFPEVSVFVASRTYPYAVTWEEVAICDIVIPCVPISRFEECVERLVPMLWDSTILVDVCTVKSMPVSCLKKFPSLRYLATHPMFWPQSYNKQGNSLEDLRVVLCDSSLSPETMYGVTTLLQQLWLRVIQMTADQHDKKLASTLFLTHYISQIVYDWAFDRTDIDTVTFWYLMDAVESVAEDKTLFLDVWKHNPHCKDVISSLHSVQRAIDTELWVESDSSE